MDGLDLVAELCEQRGKVESLRLVFACAARLLLALIIHVCVLALLEQGQDVSRRLNLRDEFLACTVLLLKVAFENLALFLLVLTQQLIILHQLLLVVDHFQTVLLEPLEDLLEVVWVSEV